TTAAAHLRTPPRPCRPVTDVPLHRKSKRATRCFVLSGFSPGRALLDVGAEAVEQDLEPELEDVVVVLRREPTGDRDEPRELAPELVRRSADLGLFSSGELVERDAAAVARDEAEPARGRAVVEPL